MVPVNAAVSFRLGIDEELDSNGELPAYQTKFLNQGECVSIIDGINDNQQTKYAVCYPKNGFQKKKESRSEVQLIDLSNVLADNDESYDSNHEMQIEREYYENIVI